MPFWLMKSEPDAFSIDDLRDRPEQTEPWDGIRNYQARNFMRDRMRVGDRAFFYHSNCKEPGIVGIMEIASAAYPDPKQFDANSKYFDPKATLEQPRWQLVDVRYLRHLKRCIPLAELRAHDDGALKGMRLLAKGNRLSIMPVAEEHWDFILSLE